MKESVANKGRSEELVVRLLLDLYAKGKQTSGELAARYGVSTRTITISRGRNRFGEPCRYAVYTIKEDGV